MKIAYFRILIILLFLFTGILYQCKPEEEFITDDPDIQLSFDADSVYFDTVLTGRTTYTRRLKVFNPQTKAVDISSIYLRQGSASPFTIYINGKPGNTFSSVFLRGKDSLLVLVKGNPALNNQPDPLKISDRIVFEVNESVHEVPVVLFGQDVETGNPTHFLSDTVLQITTPWLIRDSVFIGRDAHVSVEAGSEIIFENKAFLRVMGDLTLEGTGNQPVVLRNVRVDSPYHYAPGQWGGIFVDSTSSTVNIKHTQIRNSRNGIYVANRSDSLPLNLNIQNARIENLSRYGLRMNHTQLQATNVLVANAGNTLLLHQNGGVYDYNHCTLVNSGTGFSNSDVAVFTRQEESTAMLSGIIKNSIVWNGRSEAVILRPEKDIDMTIESSLVRSDGQKWSGNDNITGQSPLFINPQQRNFHLDSLSPAIDSARTSTVTEDLAGNPRDARPDMGAFEYIKEDSLN